MPVTRPDNAGVRPARSPDGSLLGWLQVNYPSTYAAIVNAPRDTNRSTEPKGSKARKKRRVISPTNQSQDAAARPMSTRTRS